MAANGREAAGQLLDAEAPASFPSCSSPSAPARRLLRSETEPLPGLKGRRNRQQLRRMRRREHEVDTMISPEEYEALPPSIRKKYFSTHERLQIAQHAAANRRKRQSVKKTWLDSPVSESPPRPQSINKPVAKSPRRSSRLTATQEHVTENEALWFLSLPEKVKRQQFSREEQAVLTQRCESKLRSGSPESAEELYRRRLTFSREEGSSYVPRRRSSLPTSTELDEETLAELAAAEPKSLRSAELEHDDEEMIISKSRSRRQSSDTSRISLPPRPISPAFVELKRERKRTFRRSFSLKPLPLPPPTLTPMPALPSPSSAHQLDRPNKLRRSKTDPIFEHRELPADAKYILDPKTRKALRSFASPQMFDETVHFGFPSAETEGPSSTETPGSDHVRDYSLTFSSSEDEDSTDARSPATPTHHGNFTEPGVLRNLSSADSDPAMPLQQMMSFGGKTPDYRRSPSFGQREPTLRMTLTRPDLRAPESELYGWQKPETNEDPLALAALPVCDDPTGAHGAFAVQEVGAPQVKGIKKVWKTLIRQ